MNNMNKKNDDLQLEVEKTYSADKPIFYVKGRLDTQTSEEFQEIIDEYLDELEFGDASVSGFILTLDFSEVNYISSAGLRVILYTQKKLKNFVSEANIEHERLLSIINVRPPVMEIFEMTGFTEMISISPFSTEK